MNSVHYSSKSDDWATPQAFFDKMNEKYGPFDLDVCASAENAKCSVFYSEQSNGLQRSWAHRVSRWDGEKIESQRWATCWMNPPYGRTIGLWVKKASEEAAKGCTVVCLLPARTDTKYFHDYIYNKPNVTIEFIKGRLKFGDAKHAAPFPSMIVVFRPQA